MRCRSCNARLTRVFADLGEMPSVNRYLSRKQLSDPEPRYPLKVFVCEECFLVQLPEFHKSGEIFTADYSYFSSYVGSSIERARDYCDMVVPRFGLGPDSLVIEIGSNDGYLLQHFVDRNIPCLGIDPAAKTARAAKERGVETVVDFFSAALARRVKEETNGADLIVGNNVLAHVAELNDFVEGLAVLLNPGGVVSVEFPHLVNLVESVQFDTIYDEHFCYFSLHAVRDVLDRHGLLIFDVDQIGTHGGSLRVLARHRENDSLPVSDAVGALGDHERSLGLLELDYYLGFQAKISAVRDAFLSFIAEEKRKGRRAAAFGAAAKGTVFLNYCGVGSDTIEFVVDDTPAKQGRYLPGIHIPVVGEERLRQAKPDIVVILPWNLKDEIIDRIAYARDWGARFVTCIPRMAVW